MRLEAQKKAESKYRQSKKGKAAKIRHAQTEKGKATHKRGDARYAQSENGKVVNARVNAHHLQTEKGKAMQARGSACYNQTEKGKIIAARVNARRKRDLGYKPINNWFPGSEGHHINKEDVLFIPVELHRSIAHRQDDLESMKEINDVAFEWFYIEEII